MSINVNRIILKANNNDVSPTGFGAGDAPTILRKLSTLLGSCAQGAASSNVQLSYNPVAALATITTTNTGSETASDTLTVGNVVITFETSAAVGASNQVNIAAGTAGTSTGKATGAITTAPSASGLAIMVNINGDGPQICYFNDAGTHTGAGVAAGLQTAIRALTPFNALNAVAYSSATAAFSSTHYIVTSGVKGNNSSVVITSAPGNTGAAGLELGILNGGTEAVGTYTTNNGIAALINGQTLAAGFTTKSTSFAGICTAFACGNVLTLTAAIPGTIGNGLALAVSSTGTVMALTHVWGAATAGTEGTLGTFKSGL